MPGPKSGYRTKLFRAVHVEAAKRGLDHDALHDLCAREYGVHSMSQVSESQLEGLYRQWTGKGMKRRAALPRAGEGKAATAQIVSGDELLELGREFGRRGLEEKERANFVRRQLRGRSEIRTRGDFVAVLGGLRAMRKREEAARA